MAAAVASDACRADTARTRALSIASTATGRAETARRYESAVHEHGKSLLAVHADNGDWAGKAKDVLESAGAVDVDTKSEAS